MEAGTKYSERGFTGMLVSFLLFHFSRPELYRKTKGVGLIEIIVWDTGELTIQAKLGGFGIVRAT